MSTKKPSSAGSPTSPILNGPYQEPELHYATTPDGNLDYQDRRRGRRIFAPETPQVPLGRQPQAGMFDINDFAAQYRDHLVNHLRELVGRWRRDGYPGVTSRVTRELLAFWFENPQRATWQQLFFAQREAVETAIWLNEVAEKSNPGTHVLGQLRLAQETVDQAAAGNVLPRVAFKRDYRLAHPDKSADALSDADILREVVNTVGRPGKLGEHIRCVVSVGMLTDGWAPTP